MKKIKIWGLIFILAVYPFVPGIVLAQSASESAEMTGNAISVAETVVETNTTEINSSVDTDVIPVVAPDEEIEVFTTSPSPDTASDSTQSKIEIANSATSSDSAHAVAITGENEQVATGSSAKMETGDAIALATSTSLTNTTLINSSLSVAVVAILSAWNSDLVVDAPNHGEDMISAFSHAILASLRLENTNATVMTDTLATANTGSNTQQSEGATELMTGEAIALSQNHVYVNNTILDQDIFILKAANLWLWTGMIMNWEYPGSISSAREISNLVNEVTKECGEACSANLDINNTAKVENSATAIASTGDNTQTATDTEMTTGNAYAGAVTTTMVNTTLINSRMRELNLLLFAPWSGNLVFRVPVPEKNEDENESNGQTEESEKSTQTPTIRLSSKTNINSYVYPGDSVTYEMVVSNDGPIAAKNLELTHNFYNPEGRQISALKGKVGDLNLNQRKTIRFVMKLSDELLGGEYYSEGQVNGESDQGAKTTSNVVKNDVPLKLKQLAKQIVKPKVEATEPIEIEDGEILGAESDTIGSSECVAFPWYIAITLGSFAYFMLCRKRREYTDAIKWGLALPLAAYVGLIWSNPSCSQGIMLLPSASAACQLFLPFSLGIYDLVMGGGKRILS